jgi:quercetin dioxygenase-like cupin family protein
MTSPTLPQPHTADTKDALSEAWLGTIARGLRVPGDAVLNPQASVAIKSRLMQRIVAQNVNAPADNAQVLSIKRDDAWVSLGKKIQVKILHDNGTTLSWLLKLLPGGRLPHHDHNDGLEECMILEGQLRINGEPFVCGDYQIAYPGSVHFEVASDQGALVFLKSPSSRRADLTPA